MKQFGKSLTTTYVGQPRYNRSQAKQYGHHITDIRHSDYVKLMIPVQTYKIVKREAMSDLTR